MGLRVSLLLLQAEFSSDSFEENGETSYIDRAINLDRQALALCPPGYRNRPVALNSLGFHLFSRYKRLGDMQDLEEAIVLNREALALCPPGHLGRSGSLNNFATYLSCRYDQLGGIQDLQEAIVLQREALGFFPPGDPDRSTSLNNLAASLSTRYQQLGVMQDLEEAIVLDQEALGLLPPEHPPADRSASLSNLAHHLCTRYKQHGVVQDLEEAIVLEREALGLFPPAHPGRSVSLSNLALHLYTRYQRNGVVQDLEEAIFLGREALGLRPPGHPGYWMSLNNLASHLCTRYEQLGDTQDLEEAIALERDALGLFPPGNPYRSTTLSNLATHLCTRYTQLGVMHDLEEAIVLNREALELYPSGHPGHSTSLNNLAMYLSIRYEQLGVMQDLEEAIVLEREALGHFIPGHPDRSTCLSNLALHLCTRYNQLGVTQDLEEAISLDREALGLLPPGHPGRLTTLKNFAPHLWTRYRQLRVMQDLEEAIVLDREALGLCPPGHPGRSTSLNNLAVHLWTRYKQFCIMQDLEDAIVLDREALELHPPGHPDRSKPLRTLPCFLHTRFTTTRDPKDQEELFNLYVQLSHLLHPISSTDIPAVGEWIDMAEEFQHSTLLLAYETFLRFLAQYLATLPSLPKHHILQKQLVSSIPADAFSACLRNNVPDRAVELLEQGRSVFWNQLSQLHSPLLVVMESGSEGKALADEFTQLSSQIHSVLNALDQSAADRYERMWRLNLKLQQVVTSIRSLPGLSRFLLPSLFSDLQSAAREGPVIILNASKYSCDALIVFYHRDPVHIPLQIKKASVLNLSKELHSLTKRAKKEDMSRPLAGLLRQVWDDVVGPIATVLETTLPHGSRIWWCPTSEFSLLPLHAAGPFRKGQRGLAAIYVSSYTPTLTSLIRARQHASPSSTSEGLAKRFLVVGQANASGESELHSVGTELADIGRLLGGHTTFTCIQGEDSNMSRVVDELGGSEWAHFACHGIPNPKRPFESAFGLHDGRFTIERIIGCRLQNPEFAYLSACHTTVGDEESPDEAIHLAAAMQFLGFKSVIGTMWAVDDSVANKITSTFYKHMLDESGRLDCTRAALALNKTMRNVDIPFDQRILYVHIGV